MADNFIREVDRADRENFDQNDQMFVESFEIAATEPVAIAATEPIETTANMGSESVEESYIVTFKWNYNPEPEDIHRPYPLTQGHGPAVCDLANDERERVPSVAQKTPGNLLLCALWALAIAMSTHSEKTDRLEIQLEQYYQYQALLGNLASDDFKAAIDRTVKN